MIEQSRERAHQQAAAQATRLQLRTIGEFLLIGAGTEHALARRGDEHCADRAIVFRRIERLDQCRLHRLIHRVRHRRSIEREHEDFAVAIDKQCGYGTHFDGATLS